MANNSLQPDLVLASPAAYATTSAEKLCKAMAMDAASIISESSLYDGNVRKLLELVSAQSADKHRILLVGHKPGFIETIKYLVDDDIAATSDGNLLPPASLAHLSLPGDWTDVHRGCANLRCLKNAKILPDKFPYPAPDGAERRDRPAYYYHQSAVVPYRYRDNQAEVLLIGSSKRKHWGHPQGYT